MSPAPVISTRMVVSSPLEGDAYPVDGRLQNRPPAGWARWSLAGGSGAAGLGRRAAAERPLGVAELVQPRAVVPEDLAPRLVGDAFAVERLEDQLAGLRVLAVLVRVVRGHDHVVGTDAPHHVAHQVLIDVHR